MNEQILGELTARKKLEPTVEFILVADFRLHSVGPVGISCVSSPQTLLQRLISPLCWC